MFWWCYDGLAIISGIETEKTNQSCFSIDSLMFWAFTWKEVKILIVISLQVKIHIY